MNQGWGHGKTIRGAGIGTNPTVGLEGFEGNLEKRGGQIVVLGQNGVHRLRLYHAHRFKPLHEGFSLSMTARRFL